MSGISNSPGELLQRRIQMAQIGQHARRLQWSSALSAAA